MRERGSARAFGLRSIGVSQVLARVIPAHQEGLRGPDVLHRIAVDRAWLERGEHIELELPRNLTCASCEGGGCDRCQRSGAVTLRDRTQAPEQLQLTLPRRSIEEQQQQPIIVLRVPEQGGAATEQDGLPRGLLLLKVVAAEQSEPGVILAPDTVPPMPAPAEQRVFSLHAGVLPKARRRRAVGLTLAAALGVLAALWHYFSPLG